MKESIFEARSFFILSFILLISLALRLYAINTIPASLNPDEAALGYNSYSILKTGSDEHGAFLPLSLKSFGDWKLPGYSYITTIPIFLFGLSESSIRLPSVIAGVVGVLLIYYIAYFIFKKRSISQLIALFFALSPWNIYFSRAAYEVNLGLTFFLLGLFFFLLYLNKKSSFSIISSGICFGLTFFTYHAFAIFVPLFLAGLVIRYWKNIDKKTSSVVACSIVLFLLVTFIVSTIHGGVNKIATLNIFNDQNIIYERAEKLRGDRSKKNDFIEKILFNKFTGVSYQLAQNYLLSFSPSFLFDKGGEKLVHNLGSIGNLYLTDVVFLFIGFITIFWNREKQLPLLLIWLIACPIASIITRDTPNSTRLYMLMPLFVLLSAYGAHEIITSKLKKVGVFLMIIVCGLYIINVLYFLDIYFVHMNVQRIRFWHYGYKQSVELAKKYPSFNVVMKGPENFPYIYFLFYEKYDPLKFRKEVEYYPPTSEGFYFVKKFGRFSFVEKINYESLKPETIYIDSTRLDDKKHSILLPNGDLVFGFLITQKK